MKTGFRKKNFLAILSVIMLFMAIMGFSAWINPLHADDFEEYVPDQVVVKLNPAGGTTIAEINASYGTTTLDTILGSAGIYLLQIAPGQTVEEVLDVMEDDPRLLYAEPNFIGEIPEGDPSETWAWGGYDPTAYFGQYAAELLNLSEAHAVTLGAGTVVAVLDSGAQLDHPQLAGQFTAARYDFIDDDGIPEDEFNNLDDDGDSLIDEGAGHGTHVAGIVNLVAPEAQIMPLRVLDSDGRGNDFLVAEAIQFAIQNGAQVINLSLGTSAFSTLMEDIIGQAVANGVVVVAAAGNMDTNNEQYPAAGENVLAISSVGPQSTKSSFANYGPWVDLVAPGESITSTFPTDGYARWSGTSMATPFVSGQATLIRSIYPEMPVTDIIELIQFTAQSIEDLNPNYTGQLGAGLADIGASVTPGDVLYASSSTNGLADGLRFGDEDILAFDMKTKAWSLHFDGSDVGLGASDVNAFELMADGTILLSLQTAAYEVPGVGSVSGADIVKFIPTTLGNNTAGSFEMFFDGSDVGLDTTAEIVDAIGFAPDGKLLVSTTGNFNAGLRGKDEDLFSFSASSLGWETTGTWAMYFDGSDVELTDPAEDIGGVWVDSATGDIYLSTFGEFEIPDHDGDGADIFVCAPGSLGNNTTCTFMPGLFWDGSENGFAGEVLDDIFIRRGQPR